MAKSRSNLVRRQVELRRLRAEQQASKAIGRPRWIGGVSGALNYNALQPETPQLRATTVAELAPSVLPYHGRRQTPK